MKLTILIISLIHTFIFLTRQSSSFQSCSKINSLSFETNPDHLSCTVDSDSTLQIPLATLTMSKLSIQLSDGQETSLLLLQKDFDGDFYLNFISKNIKKAFYVSTALKTIEFVKTGSTFSFTLENSKNAGLDGTLNPSTNSTLIIYIIEPYSSKISPSSTSRFLFECSDGTFEIDGMCVRVCPTKFYKENNVCWPCGEGCGLCLSSTQCNLCQGITYFDSVTQTCVSECPEGYFQDYNNRVCVQCSEGCLKCNFPDGECTSSSFKRDMIINLVICLVMVALITLCAYYCNKEAPEEQQSQPPQSQQENPEKSNQEVPESVQRKGPRKGSNLLGPYNMLYEDPDVPEDGGEEDQIHSRRKKKRLTEFAKSRLLNISMSKPFEVDDGNQDKAISHDSACKLFSTSASPMIGKSRFDLSPMIISKSPLLSSYVGGGGTGRNLLSSTNMDDQQQQVNEKQQEKQDQKAIKTRSILFNMEDSPLKKARENLKKQLQTSDEKNDAAPLALSSIKVEYHHQFDTNEDEQVKPQKEDEVVKEVSEPERDENTEGYKPDLSISSFVDKDDFEDLSSCTICGMNKRDCIIQPCRHTIACYACMEQFKENYGVCPRCQKMITGIQKMNNK